MSSTALQFDIIFAGGGTAAGVAAGRLAKADPSLKILLLEAGPTTLNDPAHIQPARYLSHLAPDSTTVKHNIANPSAYLGGRSAVVPCGQCLGGGSSVNFMMYTRASASDYDDWETKFGNVGWGSKDLLPLLKKIETYQVQEGEDTHGYSGPLKVSLNETPSSVAQDFVDVFCKYDTVREMVDDANDLSACNVIAPWSRWIDKTTGTRSDVPHHFVYPLLGKTGLVVKTESLVKRVIFEDGRAVGVEFVQNPRFYPDATPIITVARASRLVVISAGAFGSPAILERSGIGAKLLLDKFGIRAVVDLPGVGEGYQDHSALIQSYIASEDIVTLDGIIRNDPAEVEKWSAPWMKNGSGLMASNGIDVAVKVRPTEEELQAIGPDFDTKWKEYFSPAPDKPVLLITVIPLYLGLPIGLRYDKFFTVAVFLSYPSAVGHVHITSGEDVQAPTDFDPGFLRTDDDLALLVWGYKRARELARRMKCYRGEYSPNHPVFPEGSAAACHENTSPVPTGFPDISYTQEDDSAIKAYVRAVVATTWHSLGTCSMKPREEGGVVDSHLNVYGVKGLKVADMSIAPGNVGSNTYSTALTIGEKAALIIASELGIPGV